MNNPKRQKVDGDRKDEPDDHEEAYTYLQRKPVTELIDIRHA